MLPEMLSDLEVLVIGELYRHKKIGKSYIPEQRLMKKIPPDHRGELITILSRLQKKIIVEKHKGDCWSLNPILGVRIAKQLDERGEFERVTMREPKLRELKPIYKIFMLGKGWKGRFNILQIVPTDNPDIPLFSRSMYRQMVTASFICPHCGFQNSVFSFEVGISDCYREEIDLWCSSCRLPSYHCLKDLTVLGKWSLEEALAMKQLFEQLKVPKESRGMLRPSPLKEPRRNSRRHLP